MFTKKDASLVIDILKSIMPEALIHDPDIIIAGGAALNLYLIQTMLESMNPAHIAIPIKSFIRAPVVKFSDVDLWITKGSASENLRLFNLSSGNTASICIESGEKLTLINSSSWANTYTAHAPGNNYVRPIQCIVKEQDSPEDLLSTFDLGICSVAIYRGEFIAHESFFKTLDKKEIHFNKAKNIEESFPSRAYNTLRFFKYFDKTGFDFSKEVYDAALLVIYDASSFSDQFEKTANSQIGAIVNVKITTNQNYEQEIISKENVVGMVRSLAGQFHKLQGMKHWDISNALFMPKSKLFNPNGIIKIHMDKSEGIVSPLF